MPNNQEAPFCKASQQRSIQWQSVRRVNRDLCNYCGHLGAASSNSLLFLWGEWTQYTDNDRLGPQCDSGSWNCQKWGTLDRNLDSFASRITNILFKDYKLQIDCCHRRKDKQFHFHENVVHHTLWETEIIFFQHSCFSRFYMQDNSLWCRHVKCNIMRDEFGDLPTPLPERDGWGGGGGGGGGERERETGVHYNKHWFNLCIKYHPF